MKYIKILETLSKDTLKYQKEIENLLKLRNYNLNNLTIKNGEMYYNDNKIIIDDHGNVKIDKGVVSKIIGQVSLKPTIKKTGNLFTPDILFKYKNGDEIQIGDSVIIDNDYMATVDGFYKDQVSVIDMEENTFYVYPSQIEKD